MESAVWGILAHVDAGKTTLSEALLYNSGSIDSIGRVDHGDAFLDTDSIEKDRGITIFSKPARFNHNGVDITLLDTPGHVDFATETERALWALDGCILLISGADGVQPHTKTLFRLLQSNHIPTIIFVNKMDQEGADKMRLLSNIKKELSEQCIEKDDIESIAMADESAMEEFLENDNLSSDTISRLIINNMIYPVFFGAALKNEGIDRVLDEIALVSQAIEPNKSDEFGGRVYKIESLGSDARLTFMKITSGSIRVKEMLPSKEKIDQIRLYSGAKYSQVDSAEAGNIVALVGPKNTYSGQGLGIEENRLELLLNPVLQFQIIFDDATVPKVAYQKLYALNDEDPSLNVRWDEALSQIKINLMGQVQTEILIKRIKDILGYDLHFEESGVLYKETISEPVEGVGHFEPLRHYSEVHLLMEPLKRGGGIQVESTASTDQLALNWQRLIETHILEKVHVGTAIGAPLTDIKFTILGGKAHIKHTEGGDFREATYRAIRQGLMEIKTQILEPYYNFEIMVDPEYVGRAMTDVEKRGGSFDLPENVGSQSRIRGKAPAKTIRNYQSEIAAYSKGQGHIDLSFAGYFKCNDEQLVIEEKAYNPETDLENPSSSIFCSHGAATIVPWYEVKNNCHVPCMAKKVDQADIDEPINSKRPIRGMDEWIDPDEIDKILSMATHNNGGKNPKKGWHYGESKVKRVDSDYVYLAPKQVKPKEKYLLVDGYNLIHAWPELKSILEVNLDGARGKLLDILSNYKAMTDYNVIAVFDAYRVKGHPVEASDYLNIHQVFTAEAQTADAYIERFSHEHGKKYDVTVVTSDGLEQIIIRGAGARLISSREFIIEIENKARELREQFSIEEN